MKSFKKPALIIGLISAILLFIGLGLKTYNDPSGNIVLYAGAVLAGIFWVWSIAAVISAPDMKPFQKRFWLIVVIAVPVLGGLVFHVMHQERGKIVT